MEHLCRVKKIRKLIMICSCFCICLFICGCAVGSKSFVEAPTVLYPVSFSGSVRNNDGSILYEDEFDVVGTFYYKYKSVHMLMETIPLTKVKMDISQELNSQIKEVHGEAIINLEILCYKNPWNQSSGFLSLGILPGYCSVEVKGDIVRREVLNEEIPNRDRG